MMTTVFRSQLPKLEKSEFMVSFESLDPAAAPVMITQNEYMRRMKDMAATQAGMSFYAELPDSYNLIVNTAQKNVADVMAEAEKALEEKIAPLRASVETDNSQLSALRAEYKDGKPSDEQAAREKELMDAVETARKEQEKLVSDYAAHQPVVRQMIDLALLSNGLLQGRELKEFIKRSVEMLGK